MDTLDTIVQPERKMIICVDLDKYPGLKIDVDESIRFEGSGRVCSIRHNDYFNEMEIEVTKFSVPTHTHESVGPMNEADAALGKLKSGGKY